MVGGHVVQGREPRGVPLVQDREVLGVGVRVPQGHRGRHLLQQPDQLGRWIDGPLDQDSREARERRILGVARSSVFESDRQAERLTEVLLMDSHDPVAGVSAVVAGNDDHGPSAELYR